MRDKKEVSNFLDGLGVTENLQGRKLLDLAYDFLPNWDGHTFSLYENLGKKSGKSAKAIDRCINTALLKGIDSKPDVWYSHMADTINPNSGNPTNLHVLRKLQQYIIN